MASLERYLIHPTSQALVAGDVVCMSSSAGRRALTFASPAALAVARRPYGVMPAAAAPNTLGTVRVEGPISPLLTGLAAGNPGPCIVSGGRVIRTAELQTGDFYIGTADPLGWLTVMPERAFALDEGEDASLIFDAPLFKSAGHVQIGTANADNAGSMSSAHYEILNRETHRRFNIQGAILNAADDDGATMAFYDLAEYDGNDDFEVDLPDITADDIGKWISFSEVYGSSDGALTINCDASDQIDGNPGPMVVAKSRATFTLVATRIFEGFRQWRCSPPRVELEAED